MKHQVECGCAYDDQKHGIWWCEMHLKAKETLLQKNEADEMNSRLRAMLNEIRARAYNDNSDLGAWIIRYIEVDCVEKRKDQGCPECGLGVRGKDALCTKHYSEYLGQNMARGNGPGD